MEGNSQVRRNSPQDLSETILRSHFRWVKFEEDVEFGGRWSKPHVATLSLHSLLELRNFILNGSVLLDMPTEQLPMIVGLFSSLSSSLQSSVRVSRITSR